MRGAQLTSCVHQLTLLEKGEIEELVRLSYQALERNLEERSRTLINERGWGQAIDAMNGGLPGTRSSETWGPSQFPPRPEYWNQNNPLHDTDLRGRPYTGYENIYSDHSPPAREYRSATRRAGPIIIPPPIEGERQEQDTMKTVRPEVRFTLPRAQLVSDTSDIAKKAQISSAKPDIPAIKADDELQSVRQKLERVKKRREEAEKAKDTVTASDLTYFVIPGMEAELERLVKQQREEQEKSTATVFQNGEDKRSRHTEVETESESSDDEGVSEAEA